MGRSGLNLAFIYFFLLLAPLRAQDVAIPSHVWKEAGLPYIQNFSPKDYQGGIQNFIIVQDHRGTMYIGNDSGVLIYDGVSWRLIEMPNQSAVRSLCVVKDRIYVGAVGELGYIEADAKGRLQYTSLRKDIPEEHRDFKDVYDTLAIGDTIYFRTRDAIFRWVAGQVRVWKSSRPIQQSFVANGRFYVVRQGLGLMQMVKDSLQLLPSGRTLANEQIRTVIPFDGSKLLFATFAHGLFLYDGSGIKRFSTSIDAFLYQNQLRHAANLPGGLIALATVRGVVIIDRAGNFCQLVNKVSGLRDEYILSLFVDRQGGLWLGLNNGIARIEAPAPFSRFQAKSGLESYVESIVRHKGVLYVATDRGVRYLDTTTETYPFFKTVDGFSTISWSFLSTGSELLVGTQNGIFAVIGAKSAKLNELAAVTFYRPKQDSSFIFVGSLDGLAVLRRLNNRWITLGMINDIPERIYTFAEDKTGVIWAGTPSQSILKIGPDFSHLREGRLHMPVTRFGKEHGLPPGLVSPACVGNKLFFLTSKGLRHFAANQERFPPDSTFGSVFADTLTRITQLREDARGNVWIVATRGDETYNGRAVPQPDGSYQWDDTPFLRMHDLGDVYFTYPEEDGTVWFGGVEGIARYTPYIAKNYEQDYPTLIRKVRGITADSVFYHGASLSEPPYPEIEHKNNSLRFEFAAASYDDVSANRYQFKLEGFDQNWSNWTHETKKDYTGLPAGDYTFRVRAKNVYDHVSTEGIFSFAILPPWYQTWWAYLVYMVMASGLIALIVKGRVRYLEKKTKELEAIVSDRTAQIVEQKSKIEEQAQRLQELDRMKSRFFANISHEFRTPLTLILGPLEGRIAKAKKKVDKQEFGMMRRNAGRLLQLINQLLDLSRLESGKMKLNARRGDFVVFLKGIVMSFASLAEQKKITLTIEIPRHFESAGELVSEPCEGSKPSRGFEDYFDPDKIEKIFTNLLSNAFKFTPERGRVSVVLAIEPPFNSPLAKGGQRGVEITIEDTGVGIAADRLSHIFDRFYQVDDTSTREHA
ncbi:MAG: histidine kinase dimerization/phospho-acceptor domain-containing protein, partial [bacterium]